MPVQWLIRWCAPALLFTALAAGVQAADFDETFRPPRATSVAALRSTFDEIAGRSASTPATAIAALRDSALTRQRFDARWMLGTLVDARIPLTEFAELGLEPIGEGRYVIDTGAHPEWLPLAESLIVLADPTILDGLSDSFSARGFQPEDHTALRHYIETHDLKRARDARQLDLLISASRKAKKLEKAKRLDDKFMASLFYQKRWALAEADRQWATGLLDSISPMAQRVLESYFAEVTAKTLIAPEDTAAAYQYERELLLKPDFETLIRTAFQEGKL